MKPLSAISFFFCVSDHSSSYLSYPIITRYMWLLFHVPCSAGLVTTSTYQLSLFLVCWGVEVSYIKTMKGTLIFELRRVTWVYTGARNDLLASTKNKLCVEALQSDFTILEMICTLPYVIFRPRFGGNRIIYEVRDIRPSICTGSCRWGLWG